MDTDSNQAEHLVTPLPRTGPIGRLARLGWAVVFALTLGSIVDTRGSARFRDPHVLSEASAWLLHALMLVVFLAIVGALAETLGWRRVVRRAQAYSLFVVAGIALVLGAIGQLTRGAVWGFPLADGVWTFDVLMATEQLVAFILAIILGTPGCEIGVWSEIFGSARGEAASRTQVLACVVGLSQLDRWEAARHTRRTSSVR